MRKNQIKIPDHCKSIKTHVQAGFHLDRGATLALPISKTASIFIKKSQEDDNLYDLALVPLFGMSKLYVGDFASVCKMVDDYEFMVLEGRLVDKTPSIFDKFFTLLQWLLTPKGRK